MAAALNSIAAEILETPRPDMIKTKSLVNDLKECLSDFGSCVEMSDSSEDNQSDKTADRSGDEDVFQTMNERKRMKKFKRKLNLTPGKEEFLKKPNLVLSPP